MTAVAHLINHAEMVVTGPKALYDWRESQRHAVPDAQFTPRFRKFSSMVGRLIQGGMTEASARKKAAAVFWDGTYTPGKYCRQLRPGVWEFRGSRGLLERMSKALTITIDNQPPTCTPTHPTLTQLPEPQGTYQRVAFKAAVEYEWGRFALATNAGKGAVIALLADFAAQLGVPVLILCDTISVFDALMDEVTKWTSLSPASVSQGIKRPPQDLVSIAMVPTLSKRLAAKTGDTAKVWRKWVGRHGMVLLDEADRADVATWRRILSNTKGSRWRLGFSGTFPNDSYEDLRLDVLMGPILLAAKNIDLIERNVSATPTVTLHQYDVTPMLTGGLKKWWELSGPARRRWVYEEAIMNNYARHDFIASLIRPNTPTAVIVNRVEHGHSVTRAIKGAVFLDGSTSPAQRRDVLRQFRRGDIHILVVTKILDRGTNRLGHTTDLLFVSGEGSTKQTLQRIGRGLRRTDGKEFLRLVDIVDRVTFKSHERLLARAAKYLHTAARKRIQLYHDEGFTVEVTNG